MMKKFKNLYPLLVVAGIVVVALLAFTFQTVNAGGLRSGFVEVAHNNGGDFTYQLQFWLISGKLKLVPWMSAEYKAPLLYGEGRVDPTMIFQEEIFRSPEKETIPEIKGELSFWIYRCGKNVCVWIYDTDVEIGGLQKGVYPLHACAFNDMQCLDPK